MHTVKAPIRLTGYQGWSVSIKGTSDLTGFVALRLILGQLITF